MKRSICLTSLLLLAACSGGSVTRTLGLGSQAPDEFTVTTRAPLSVPPDLAAASLPTPTPGLARPMDVPLQQQVKESLEPQVALNGPQAGGSSAGQDALVGAAGGPAAPGIRAELAAQADKDNQAESFTQRLMFWNGKTDGSTLVDAPAEAARLQQNTGLGKPATSGETPTIDHGKSKFLGLF